MFEKPSIPEEQNRNFQEESGESIVEIPEDIRDFLKKEEGIIALVDGEEDPSKKAWKKKLGVVFLAISVSLGSTSSVWAESSPSEKSPAVRKIGEKATSIIEAAQKNFLKEELEKEKNAGKEIANFHINFLTGLEELTSNKRGSGSKEMRNQLLREYIKEQLSRYRKLQADANQAQAYGSMSEIRADFLGKVSSAGKMKDYIEKTKGKRSYYERSAEFLEDADVDAFMNIKRKLNEKIRK